MQQGTSNLPTPAPATPSPGGPAPAAGAPATYNPLLPAFRDDPHPFFHRLRAEDPVHWSPVFQLWVLTRYADVVAALREPKLSSLLHKWDRYEQFYLRGGAADAAAAAATQPASEVYRNWMLQMDPPDHTRLRGLINKAFTPRVVEQMRPRIAAIVDELLDNLRGRTEFDAIADLAYPLPIRVIIDLLGVPDDGHERVKQWSSELLPSFGPILSARDLARFSTVMGEFSAYFEGLIAERRRTPGRGLLDDLIAVRDGGNRLSDRELIATCVLIAFAGHLTTVQLIARGVLHLVRNPDQLDLVRREPARIAAAVEEVLRYDNSIQIVPRVATEDVELGGRTIRKGQLVLVSLTAANRDPAQFPDPDRFDVARAENRHVAFGYGIHYCSGAPLSRLEAQVAIAALLRRAPGRLSLAVDKVEREPSLILRAVKAVPLRVEGGIDGPAPAATTAGGAA